MPKLKAIAAYTDVERAAILACANGRERDYAICAHRVMLKRCRDRQEQLPYGDPYFEFMREIDCPMPDLLLRARYRMRVQDDNHPQEKTT
jgi:hypothetical protein